MATAAYALLIPKLSRQRSKLTVPLPLVGLERLFRGLQAVSLLASSILLPAASALYLLPGVAHPATRARLRVLDELSGRLGLARRFLRLFRFLENFAAAQAIVASGGGGAGLSLEAWLDVVARSSNGLYLLLESATLPASLGIDGLVLLPGDGPVSAATGGGGDDDKTTAAVVVYATSRLLAREAQRFWFVALAAGLAAGLVRLVKLFAYAPVPQTGQGYGTGEKGAGGGEGGATEKKEEEREKEPEPEPEPKPGSRAAMERDRARLREVVLKRKAERTASRRAMAARARAILRKLTHDALDLLIPATALGWTKPARPVLGAALFYSTWLTGQDVWRRCGRELQAAGGA